MNKKYRLAIDIGASSGKCLVGYFENDEMKTEVIHRFKNAPKEDKDNHKIWDIDYLFSNVLEAIKIAFSKYKKIESLSIDSTRKSEKFSKSNSNPSNISDNNIKLYLITIIELYYIF